MKRMTLTDYEVNFPVQAILTLETSSLATSTQRFDSSGRKLGKRIKDVLVNLAISVERAMEHDHEFDHW
ncbi:MAG: hypothetical protein WBQ89_16865 [Candidatus Acidiferrum sp.]